MKTPLSRKKYEGITCSGTFTRTWKQAIKCWWEWDVLPWFKKLDYQYGNKDKPYYRWKKYFKKMKNYD